MGLRTDTVWELDDPNRPEVQLDGQIEGRKYFIFFYRGNIYKLISLKKIWIGRRRLSAFSRRLPQLKIKDQRERRNVIGIQIEKKIGANKP